MNREELASLFESMTPDEQQKDRMKAHILNGEQPVVQVKPLRRRRIRWAASAICVVLVAVIVFLSIPFREESTAYAINVRIGSDGPVFKLLDNQNGANENATTISNIDSRPGLEFYIDGKDIAKIEVSTKNEYIYAEDWTKTQHEKYWNIEYYQKFDEKRQVSEADFSLLYDKKMTLTFDDDFKDYGDIWYRWTAWNMHKWAVQDNYSHFLGAGKKEPADLSTSEKTELAAGNDGIGHIQLEGYPEKLREDEITIIITDRQGNQTKKVIKVKVSNNEKRQTVVTASLGSK
ncbi:hypothetical protein [Paenibacillus radicis (ex Gao et al. 2016)]|uniref:Uncharacterized protein n=1 Tax=Paenibacillus radicis (ex Gao et al. 2016) TaxID=1737354 RepID=A0A917H2E4_9BACL|nr:hypothetical protein [Paenibacillus radicis (ex Gao et al. 2016)]GGG65397.1 hypothetical protein GCM10010918_19510 [Paenibacillus radicis (ex Gao et al. 2016)]